MSDISLRGFSPRLQMPDKYNPFRPDKLVKPGMFAGRIEELRTIDHCLLQTRYGNPKHFLITGERGIGKSSLIYCAKSVAVGHMPTLSDKKLNLLIVDIFLSDRDDYYSLIRKIASELRRELLRKEHLTKIVLSVWDFITKFEAAGVKFKKENHQAEEFELLSSLIQDIETIILQGGDTLDGILFLIDEADSAPESAGLGYICKMLTENLGKKGIDKICFGLAGLPILLEKLRESHGSSPRLFTTMTLEPLELEERAYVVDRSLEEAIEFNGFPIRIDDDAKSTICSLSEGYPHFLQEFGYHAFEQDNDNNISLVDVSQSMFEENGAFDQLGRKYFNQSYDATSSDEYKRVLNVMSEHSDSWIDRSAIIIEGGFKGATVDNALRALKSRNIIVQNDSKRGLYKLPTKSFAAWIKAKKSAPITG